MISLDSLNQSHHLIGALGALLGGAIVAIVSLLLLRARKRLVEQQQSDLREQLETQEMAWQSRIRELEHELNSGLLELTTVRTQLEQRNETVQEQRRQIDELVSVKEQHIELQARLQEQEKQLKSKEEIINESKNTLLKEFELAANKLFESKQQSFNQTSKQNLESVLSPFKQQLMSFNKQVEDVYHKENSQRNQLIGQISELQKQAKKISEDANNLASALKGDNKVQGSWGEIILERLLEQSGLERGREYDTQSSFKGHDGKTYRPDVIIHLPEEKDIVVDSKVALVEYEKYANSDGREEREMHLKGHVEALRAHIKMLSMKNYDSLQGIRSLDFVFMFVPIEAAYVAAIQHSQTLFKEAYDKKIMLVSPSSLMVALRTVETMWRYEKQNKNAEKIALSAGRLYDQFVLVIQALDDLGGYIRKTEESYDLVFNRLSKGRGNVVKRISDLKKLGAKASKELPKSVEQNTEDETTSLDYLESDEVEDEVSASATANVLESKQSQVSAHEKEEENN